MYVIITNDKGVMTEPRSRAYIFTSNEETLTNLRHLLMTITSQLIKPFLLPDYRDSVEQIYCN